MEENVRITCAWCGCTIENDARIGYNGDPCCDECFDERYAVCDCCLQVVDIDDIVSINDGDEYVCTDCASRHYYRCTDCGDWYSYGWMSYIDPDSDDAICRSCMDDWCQCEDCGRIISAYNANWSDEDDAWYCDDCINDHRSSAYIHDYGYKPAPVIMRVPGEGEDVRTYGVELEIDDGDDADGCARDLDGITDAIYLKHDGSLGDDGIEIVTHPCSLAYHLDRLPWDDIVQMARAHGYTSHDAGTCGLHVHIGRDQLDADAPEKLVALVDAIWNKLVKFSRRSEQALYRWAARPDACITNRDDDATAKDKAAKIYGKGRYQAVNLRNPGTIELRLFRGSLRLQTIRATLQLVDTLCEYIDPHTVQQCAAATWADVMEIGRKWTDLVAYNTTRGI